MRLLAFGLAILLIGCGPAGADAKRRGGSQDLNLETGFSFMQSTRWVEQQDDWPQGPDGVAILRPTVFPCDTWAVDDHADWRAFGVVQPGASTSRTDCQVNDFNPVFATRFGTTGWWSNARYGFTGVLVHAASADLTVTVCYAPQGRCFTVGAVWDASFGAYAYTFCGRANYGPNDPALAEVPGSNGGRGVFTYVTVTVTNPTGRRVRNVRADGGISSDFFFPAGCAGPESEHSEYPFSWTAS